MKKILLFCSCLLLLVNSAFAQQYYISGGTTSNIFPFSSASSNCVQWVYYPTNFNSPSGMITTIYFRPSTSSTNSVFTNLTIKMGHTTLSAFTTGAFNSGLTTVYSATSTTLSASTGVWLAITLQTPFMYNNTQNLIVEASQTAYTTGFSLYQEGTLAGRRLYGSLTAGTGTAGTGLADFGYDIITCQQPTNVLASNVTVQGATMNWNTVSGSLGYEYVLDQNPGNPPGAGTFTSVNTKTYTGLNLATTYYFHVRNICSNGYSGWVNVPFTTLNAYCLPPTNILFTGISKTSVDLLWSKMPTSDWYEYKVDLTPNPPLTSANTLNTTGITATATGLQPGTKYYVFMRSICLNGSDSSYWKRDSFITKFYCDAPEVSIMGQGTNTPTASWLIVPDAVAYEYRITNSSATPAFGTETLNTSLNMNLEADGLDKYLHVRSKCNSQFTFSNWVTSALRTGTTGITNVNAPGTIDVYPNPATDMITVDLKELKADASIVIMDATGKVIRSVELKAKKTTVDTKGIAPGVYMLRFSDANSKELVKFNKL